MGFTPQVYHLLRLRQSQPRVAVAQALQSPARQGRDLLVAEPGGAAHIVNGTGRLGGQPGRFRNTFLGEGTTDEGRFCLRRADDGRGNAA